MKTTNIFDVDEANYKRKKIVKWNDKSCEKKKTAKSANSGIDGKTDFSSKSLSKLNEKYF